MKGIFLLVLLFPLAACGTPDDSDDDTAGDHTTQVSQPLKSGGGGGRNICRALPLHCGGSIDIRAVYPGCTAECPANETPICWAGDCFLHLAPLCVCIDGYRPPG
jgi:hypothetical protein